MKEVILPDELTPRARMKAFEEDLRALNELSVTVHRKAVEGDNAAGHLDLKIRERKAAMFGYDSPVHHDMMMIVEHRRPSTSQALLNAFEHLVASGEASEATKEHIRQLGGHLPKPTTAEPTEQEQTEPTA
jgi:hypothetical protein